MSSATLQRLFGLIVLMGLAGAFLSARTEATRSVQVADFLPSDHVTDGSVSYQAQLQDAIDSVGSTGGVISFAPIVYLIADPNGLEVHSNQTLIMEGATFVAAETCTTDGQVFIGRDVTNVQFLGGSITGHNQTWQDGINIRGILLTGSCRRITIRDMSIRDLSSNGVGVFAPGPEHPATDIRILDTEIRNCSNRYIDYQTPPPSRPGPEPGSVREDQGLIAMYHVHGFTVRGCQLEDSRSDGTHFYFCQRGQFIDNRVNRSMMGGYFLENCRDILAANNIIHDNGSRGVTIERGSESCTLIGNSIKGSGREGLWIPDSARCIVTGNLFTFNGRKTNGNTPNQTWNANITINQARVDTLATPTADYLISGNIIETNQSLVAAIRVDTRDETRNIVITNNLILGNNRLIRIEGPDQEQVEVDQNLGARTERLAE